MCWEQRVSLARFICLSRGGLTVDDPNPALETMVDLLYGLHVTANITLRPSAEGKGPVKVVIDPTLQGEESFSYNADTHR